MPNPIKAQNNLLIAFHPQQFAKGSKVSARLVKMIRKVENNNATLASSSPKMSLNTESANKFIAKLNAYIAENPVHCEKLKQDIQKNNEISSLITVRNKDGKEKVEWVGEQATKQDLDNMLCVLKSQHHVTSTLYKKIYNFKFSDLVPAQPSEVSNVPSSLRGSFLYPEKLNPFADRVSVNESTSTENATSSLSVNSPDPKNGNPFGDYDLEGASDSSNFAESATVESSYPEVLNPFADRVSVNESTSSNSTENATSSLSVSSPDPKNGNPFGGSDLEGASDSSNFAESATVESSYPEVLNPFADRVSVNESTSSNSTENAISRTESQRPLKDGVADAFLQLLNEYLRYDGESFKAKNQIASHIKKIKQDIKDPAVSKYIKIEQGEKGVEIRWVNDKLNTIEQMQELWDGVNRGHDLEKSSFGKLFKNFSFVDAKVNVLPREQIDKIVLRAANPAMHALGKSAVVAMKQETATKVLEYYLDLDNHDKRMPNDALSELVAHYGRVDEAIGAAQSKTKKLSAENSLSLMDVSLKEQLQRIFHGIQTDVRIERFESDVDKEGGKFLTTMKSQLNEFNSTFGWKAVAEKIKSNVDEDFKKAHEGYAQKTQRAKNIFPSGLKAEHPLSSQIDSICRESHQGAITNIVKCYGETYLTNITAAVAGFDAETYFKGKSLERTADNVVKLNKSLRDLYAHAEDKIKQFVKESNVGESSQDLEKAFSLAQTQLKTAIHEKTLANDMTVFNLLQAKVDNLPKLNPAQVKKSFWQRSIHKSSINISTEQADKLLKLSQQLKEDKIKIINQERLGSDGVPTELSNKINTVNKTILDKTPEKESFSKKLREGFKEAFKPNWLRILGGGGMAAGLTAGVIVAATTPVLVALAPIIIPSLLVSVGVAAAIWVGKNVYEHVQKLKQFEVVTDQIRENCNSVAVS
ncbi:hypothetical protein [Iodobacter fluviatilis]|uniref:Uncharacterized protein n=1 Tax=Iodobacter fluviatilis TaxID=537 RepID=A0A7G3GC14_9NEIS|nr:hypothetical protein [Iodobacter fluviatilis]QBC44698.1 hypothetical protein C1H71_14945 [Iodobacter fluviatilis]